MSHGRDEHVARRLRPARGGGAPGEVALARAEPVLGLHALAGQVALPVADRLGLARGPRGEGDQRRVVGRQVGGRRGRRVVDRLVGDRQQRAVEAGLADGLGVPLVGHDGARLRADPSARAGPSAAAARCRGARRRRCGSRRPSPRPTRGGSRSRSSRRPRGRRRARSARPPAAPRAPTARRRRSRASNRLAESATSAVSRAWRGRHNFRCEVHAQSRESRPKACDKPHQYT